VCVCVFMCVCGVCMCVVCVCVCVCLCVVCVVVCVCVCVCDQLARITQIVIYDFLIRPNSSQNHSYRIFVPKLHMWIISIQLVVN